MSAKVDLIAANEYIQRTREQSILSIALSKGNIPLIKKLIFCYGKNVPLEAALDLLFNTDKIIINNYYELFLLISKCLFPTINEIDNLFWLYSIITEPSYSESKPSHWTTLQNDIETKIKAISISSLSPLVILKALNRFNGDINPGVEFLIRQFFQTIYEGENLLQKVLMGAIITQKPNLKIAKWLIQQGVNIEIPDLAFEGIGSFVGSKTIIRTFAKTSLLLLSISVSQSREIIDFLLANKANPNARHYYYKIFSEPVKPETVIPEYKTNKTTIREQAKEIQKKGHILFETPLIRAVLNNNYPIVESLLNHPQIAVNAVEIDGRTALSHAAEQNNLAICKLLVAKGADIELLDYKDKSAIDYAPNSDNNNEVRNFLLGTLKEKQEKETEEEKLQKKDESEKEEKGVAKNKSIEEQTESLPIVSSNTTKSTPSLRKKDDAVAQHHRDFSSIQSEYHLLKTCCSIVSFPDISKSSQAILVRNAICQLLGEMFDQAKELHSTWGSTLLPLCLAQRVRNALFHPEGTRFSVSVSNTKKQEGLTRNIKQAARVVMDYLDGKYSDDIDPLTSMYLKSPTLKELATNSIPTLTENIRCEQLDIAVRELSAYRKMETYLSGKDQLPFPEIIRIIDKARLYTYHRLQIHVTEDMLLNYQGNACYEEMLAAIHCEDLWQSRHSSAHPAHSVNELLRRFSAFSPAKEQGSQNTTRRASTTATLLPVLGASVKQPESTLSVAVNDQQIIAPNQQRVHHPINSQTSLDVPQVNDTAVRMSSTLLQK